VAGFSTPNLIYYFWGVTLLKIQQLIGLLIFGWFYDEFMVSPADLGDSSRFLPSLRRMYEIHHYLRRGHPDVHFGRWIAYFTDQVHTRPEGLDSTQDPFGTGRLEIHHNDPIPSQSVLCSHDMDRETPDMLLCITYVILGDVRLTLMRLEDSLQDTFFRDYPLDLEILDFLPEGLSFD
jgi:hypothetical protein